ncbi:MAG: hypothetical protein Q4F27_04980 [Desulfovibrionaceae bacterium]|nr:hypothetical protein [Desulfovibrionaceae bacterium]
MSFTADDIAARLAELSVSFFEAMGMLGIPHGTAGIYADYLTYETPGERCPREETCGTALEYIPLAQGLVTAPAATAFEIEHVRTFHDELDFLTSLETAFQHVSNGFTEGLRRCIDLHRCIPGATLQDEHGRQLRQSHFETRFSAIKRKGDAAVCVSLAVEYFVSELYRENGQMEVCRMSLAELLDKAVCEARLAGGIRHMLGFLPGSVC